MAKQRVTLMLDSGNLAALRELVGARRLSAGVDAAVAAYVSRERRERKARASRIIDAVFAELPEPPATQGHGIDTTDRRAVRSHIGARLRRRA